MTYSLRYKNRINCPEELPPARHRHRVLKNFLTTPRPKFGDRVWLALHVAHCWRLLGWSGQTRASDATSVGPILCHNRLAGYKGFCTRRLIATARANLSGSFEVRSPPGRRKKPS